MQLQIQTFTVRKRFALTISRGTTSQTTNLWVKLASEGIEGWGESSPFSTGSQPQTTESLLVALQEVAPLLEKFTPCDRQKIEQVFTEVNLPSAARAGIDMAIHDWLAKKAGLPHHPQVSIPSLLKVVELYEMVAAAGGVFVGAKVSAIALNTHHLNEVDALLAIAEIQAETGLACTYPVRFGAEVLLGAIDN